MFDGRKKVIHDITLTKFHHTDNLANSTPLKMAYINFEFLTYILPTQNYIPHCFHIHIYIYLAVNFSRTALTAY